MQCERSNCHAHACHAHERSIVLSALFLLLTATLSVAAALENSSAFASGVSHYWNGPPMLDQTDYLGWQEEVHHGNFNTWHRP
jgi:hypothetical protein